MLWQGCLDGPNVTNSTEAGANMKHWVTETGFCNTKMWFRWRKPRIQVVTIHLPTRCALWQNALSPLGPSPGCHGQSVYPPTQQRRRVPEGGETRRRHMLSFVCPLKGGAAELAQFSFKPDHIWDTPVYICFGWCTAYVFASVADLNRRF